MNFIHDLTGTDIDKFDVKPQLEQQTQIQETKETGWVFDKNNSMKKRVNETGEVNGSSFVKIPLRSNAIFNVEITDLYCSYGQF